MRVFILGPGTRQVLRCMKNMKDIRKNIALPKGAAAPARATMRVINHFVLLAYSYGLSTSGMMDSLPSNPLRFDRGTIVTARESTDAGFGFEFGGASGCRGAGSIESLEDWEWAVPSSSLFFPFVSPSRDVETSGWRIGPSTSCGTLFWLTFASALSGSSTILRYAQNGGGVQVRYTGPCG